MTRRYWLSFCDDDRPVGDQFLGVAIVEVTEEEAAITKTEIDRTFPNHAEDAEWIAAAVRKAWLTCCNPGGEVASADITHMPLPEGVELPLYRLLQKNELKKLGVQ